jgi:DNA modification methylase
MRTAPKAVLYQDDTRAWGLLEGEALGTLARLPDSCVDAIVTDPPYGIDFAGEAWDGANIRASIGGAEQLTSGEAFERWTQAWAVQARRVLKPGGQMIVFGAPRTFHRVVCGVEDAGFEIRDQLLWLYAQGLPKSRCLPGGLGTTLKPAYEPILLARKPLTGTTPRNLQAWGTGALNIDASRVNGRWPTHLTFSHPSGCTTTDCTSECPAALIDANSHRSPSRLFFCAKASRREREAGCEQLQPQSMSLYNGGNHHPSLRRNTHRTVKPLALMRWLIGLSCPPGGTILDPFNGSGSTGIAAILEDRTYLGIEREPDYIDIACARLTHWAHQQERS